MTPVVGVLTALTWLFVAVTFRFSSLSALVALFAAPFYALAFANSTAALCYALLTLLSFYRHKENIKRLIRGEESKISFKKKTSAVSVQNTKEAQQKKK